MKKLIIEVNNPYYNERYETVDIDMGRWKNFHHNHMDGNETTIGFNDIDSGKYIIINPQNFASIEAFEKE